MTKDRQTYEDAARINTYLISSFLENNICLYIVSHKAQILESIIFKAATRGRCLQC